VADDTFKETVSQLANSLQQTALLVTKLRRELSGSAQDAVDCEASCWRATLALRRLTDVTR
jgi:hypothetical protein